MESVSNTLSQIEFDHQHWLNDLNYLSNEMSVYKNKLATMIGAGSEAESEELLNLLDQLYHQKKTVLNLLIKVNKHIFEMVRMRTGNGHFEKFIDHDHVYTRVELVTIKKDYAELKDKIEKISQ